MSEEYIEEGINGQWTDWKFEAENYKKIYEHLQQENKQLKEKLELKSGMNIAVQNLKLIEENKQLKDALEKLKDSAGWREILELSGIIQERDLYKEVIEEVREYIKECSSREISLDILEILDKAKVDNERPN